MTPKLKKLMLQMALENQDLRQEILSLALPQTKPSQVEVEVKPKSPKDSLSLEKIIDYGMMQGVRTQLDETEFPASEGFDPETMKPNLVLQSPSGKIKILLKEAGREGKVRKIQGVLLSELHSPLTFEMEINCPDFFGKRLAGGRIAKD